MIQMQLRQEQDRITGKSVVMWVLRLTDTQTMSTSYPLRIPLRHAWKILYFLQSSYALSTVSPTMRSTTTFKTRSGIVTITMDGHEGLTIQHKFQASGLAIGRVQQSYLRDWLNESERLLP